MNKKMIVLAECYIQMKNITGNCSFTECYIDQELIFIREVQITFLLLYTLVSLMGIVGNLLVVITIVR